MKKLFILLILCLFCLTVSSCGLNNNESNDPQNPSDPSGPIDPSDPGDPQDPTDPQDPSDPTDPSDPSDPEGPTEPGNEVDPLNYSDIELAEKIITEVFDSGLNVNKVKARKRNKTLSDIETAINGPTGLSGEFDYFYDPSNDGYMKVSSEPLSYAFGLLEFFVQNGLPETDFNGKCYFNPNSFLSGVDTEYGYTKITILSENSLAIDYYSYRMIIGKSGDDGYVLSYMSQTLTDYLDCLRFEYMSKGNCLIYSNATKNWLEEIDLLIDLFKDVDEVENEPFEELKYLYLKDGKEQPYKEHFDKDNLRHVVLPNYNEHEFTSLGVLQSYFMNEHYYKLLDGSWFDFIIEGGTLKYLTGGITPMIEIPEEVNYIESLTINPERTDLETSYYGIFFKTAKIEFAKDALDRVKRIDSIFIDEEEHNEEFEDFFKASFPNIKIYYQNEWEVKCDLILPLVEIVEDVSDHVHSFTRQIIDDAYLAQEKNCTHGVCYYYVCELCDKHGNQFYEVGEKGEHSYVLNRVFNDVEYYICEYCHIQYTHAISDTEHHYVLIEYKVPTCKEDGYTLYRCKITGDEKITYEKHFNHRFINGNYCNICHDEIVTYEEHDFVFDGIWNVYMQLHCKICGDEILQSLDFQGHSYKNGKCVECGVAEHEHQFGADFEVLGNVAHCCNICSYVEIQSQEYESDQARIKALFSDTKELIAKAEPNEKLHFYSYIDCTSEEKDNKEAMLDIIGQTENILSKIEEEGYNDFFDLYFFMNDKCFTFSVNNIYQKLVILEMDNQITVIGYQDNQPFVLLLEKNSETTSITLMTTDFSVTYSFEGYFFGELLSLADISGTNKLPSIGFYALEDLWMERDLFSTLNLEYDEFNSSHIALNS